MKRILYKLVCLIHFFALWTSNEDTRRLIEKDMSRVGMSFEECLIKYLNFRNVFYYRLGKRKIRFLCRMILKPNPGIEILCENVGGGILFRHKMGAVIHAKAVGENCSFSQGVTVGKGRNTEIGKIPIIGNNVAVYTNAVIIGGVKVGDNAIIGAGAVVTHDVPANAVMIGVPAKVIRINEGEDSGIVISNL